LGDRFDLAILSHRSEPSLCAAQPFANTPRCETLVQKAFGARSDIVVLGRRSRSRSDHSRKKSDGSVVRIVAFGLLLFQQLVEHTDSNAQSSRRLFDRRMLLVDQFPRLGRRRHVPPTCRSLMSFRATPPMRHQWLAACPPVWVSGLSQQEARTSRCSENRLLKNRRLVECGTASSERIQLGI
jgi:hypothetical protein